MSEGKSHGVYLALGRRSPPPIRPAAVKAPIPPPAPKPGGRHAAIGTKASDLKAYRRWADSIRESWQDEK